MTLLEIRSITKRYGSYAALDGVSLEVGQGECVVLLGPSGCGKTTLLRLVAGLMAPDEGEIRLNGQPLSVAGRIVPPERRGMSMVFQDYAVWPHKTVYENVSYGLQLRKLPKHQVESRTLATLERVRLRELARRYPGELSGGQQQRVALARALALEPQILLFDEPLSNLDASLREVMRFEIRQILDETGVTALYVTHDQQEAMVLADRLVVMSEGRIAQVGTPQEVYFTSRSQFVAGFVGLANTFAVEVPGGPGGDGYVQALAPWGQVLRMTLPAGEQLRPGTYQAFIRPESIGLTPAAVSGPDAVSGTLTAAVFLGSVTELRVDVGGTLLRVHLPSLGLAVPAAGSPVCLEMAPQALVLTLT